MRTKEKILIFGVGVAGRALYRKLKAESYEIIGFLDNNPNLKNTFYGDVKIFDVNDIKLLKFDKIVISGIWVKSMLQQLKHLNVHDKNILHIKDSVMNFSSSSRVETTDYIMKSISNICKNKKMNSYIIGSSLATLFRGKDLSCVADVDIFLCSQEDAKLFLTTINNSPQFEKLQIDTVLYSQDDLLAKKGAVRKIVISSNVNIVEEEASIIDVSIANPLNEQYMVRHNENYIRVPKNLCEGTRYFKYKNLELQIPNLAEEYLCLLYGENWIIPPEKWDQSDYGNLMTPSEIKNLLGNIHG